MILAVVTDEISSDPITAVELGMEWGIAHFELRSVASGRLPEISSADRGRLRSLAARSDVTLTAMSPGFFKAPLDSPETDRQSRDGLPKALDLAAELSISKMIFFAARKDDMPRSEAVPRVADLLAQCADACQEAGVLLLLENEHICWADNGMNALDILQQTQHPNIALNWDPCNSVWSGGTPFPDEYERIKAHVRHLHVKDTARDGRGEFHGMPIGEGEVPWREQLRALRRDGYEGPYTVETHYTPKVSGSRRCAENLRRMLFEIA